MAHLEMDDLGVPLFQETCILSHMSYLSVVRISGNPAAWFHDYPGEELNISGQAMSSYQAFYTISWPILDALKRTERFRGLITDWLVV